MKVLNPVTTNVPNHIETSQLICNTKQLTGFYMMVNIGRQWVNIPHNLAARDLFDLNLYTLKFTLFPEKG